LANWQGEVEQLAADAAAAEGRARAAEERRLADLAEAQKMVEDARVQAQQEAERAVNEIRERAQLAVANGVAEIRSEAVRDLDKVGVPITKTLSIRHIASCQ
jgi:F0F1-type ATP synthase membrane subunit b/b'